jgi:hypothetical protein
MSGVGSVKAAGEVLANLEIEDVPEGDTVLELVGLVKTLDVDGEVAWYVRCTSGVSDIEVMGALLVELDRRRYHKASTSLANDDEED